MSETWWVMGKRRKRKTNAERGEERLRFRRRRRRRLRRNKQKSKSEMKAPKYRSNGEEDEFHYECKRAAEKYFKENELDWRENIRKCGQSRSRFYPESFCFITYRFLAQTWRFSRWRACLRCCTGVCKAEVGVSIQHDANHGRIRRIRKFCTRCS